MQSENSNPDLTWESLGGVAGATIAFLLGGGSIAMLIGFFGVASLVALLSVTKIQ